MRVTGLTGGIATGKSTVSRILRDEYNVAVVDADQIAREVVAIGSQALGTIVDTFGEAFLDSEGGLDRAKMRTHIANDPAQRKQLEAILHPAIAAGILKRITDLRETGLSHAVVEAALMVETGSYRNYDALIVVSCSPEHQLERLIRRDGCAESEARKMIDAQLPIDEKERVATVVVRNDGGLDSLRTQVDRAWAQVSN